MSRRIVGNTIATVFATVAGGAAAYFYHRQFEVGPLSWRIFTERKLLVSWAVLVLAGLTVGTVVFFLVWGHFQKAPAPPAAAPRDAAKK